MKVFKSVGDEDIAVVYLAKTDRDHYIEFVESIQPSFPREKKWVLIVSTLLGCVVRCPMCDAGSWYKGKLSAKEILEQIDYMVIKRFPNRKVPVEKFKIQFARMGEPAFNLAVIEVLKQLPKIYDAPGLMPSISTVAPCGCEDFFSALLSTKNDDYGNGQFQLQFSIHTTDTVLRDQLIPVKKWDFEKIATYGENFYTLGDRKIVLNFALSKKSICNASVLRQYFNPDIFLIKITPINPTMNAIKNNLDSYIVKSVADDEWHVVEQLKSEGFEVIVSVGELAENKIGSNCGQYIRRMID